MIKVTEEMVAAGEAEIKRIFEGLPDRWQAPAIAVVAYLPDIYRAMRALEPADD